MTFSTKTDHPIRPFSFGRWLLAAAGCAAALAVVAAFVHYTHTLAYLRGVKEDRWALWIAAAKGFQGPVKYLGDENGQSYFHAEG